MQSNFFDTSDVLAVILGGGAGTRLFPLTKDRAKPAVPLAGKYRLVDIPISLCINSGVKRIFLLTQFLSSSLHRHVGQSYRFDDYSPRGFVEIMAAQQTATSDKWYQGTADAVRQNLIHFRNHQHNLLLILSGDQLYRMDYRDILHSHRQSGADLTVATIPVHRPAARGFGIMHVDEKRRIVRFVEKPQDDALLDSLRLTPEQRTHLKTTTHEDLFLASMGIYVFNREVLETALANHDAQDFGKHIIPQLIQTHHVNSYIYEGYWEDIGTIRAFFEANLDLTEDIPSFNFYDARSPIYSRARFLPATKFKNTRISRAIIADGCIVLGCEIDRAVLGVRSRIGENTTIKNSILMGADYFETEADMQQNSSLGRPNIGIGANTHIENTIVDKNCRIGAHVKISPERKSGNIDHPLYYLRDGIMVIPKGTVIPDGTVL